MSEIVATLHRVLANQESLFHSEPEGPPEGPDDHGDEGDGEGEDAPLHSMFGDFNL